VAVVGEQLREFVAQDRSNPRMAEQAGIMAAQQEAEDQAAQASDLVIADPAAVLTAVYSELYFSDGRLWPAAASAGRGYALLLWCRPDLPWEADPGQRDGPAYRQQADEIIARAVRDGTLMALPMATASTAGGKP
jgi:nicotinamide riboside kinase